MAKVILEPVVRIETLAEGKLERNEGKELEEC